MSKVITWANRNRILQADQNVDWLAASTGAEDGQHTALRIFDESDNLLAEKLDIDGETATVDSDHVGTLKFKLWSIRDGYESLQADEWSEANDTPDAVAGTVITAGTWYPPATEPDQPHGEPLVADGVTPPEQVTTEDETDFLYSD